MTTSKVNDVWATKGECGRDCSRCPLRLICAAVRDAQEMREALAVEACALDTASLAETATGKAKTTKLACEAVAGPPVPYCRVYSAQEIAAWEAANREPLPKFDLKALHALKARRAEERRVAKIGRELSGLRKRRDVA